MTIRPASEHDHDTIDEINRCAFDDDAEAALVRQLREDGDVICEFVVEAEGQAVGHVLFSRLKSGTARAAALAPVAVLPDRQRKGFGSRLIERGIEECRTLGFDSVYVMGEPEYYSRFGFSTETAAQVRCPYSGPYFMALVLNGSAPSGDVEYPRAFASL